MADRAVVPLVHGPLSIDIAFYREEANLWRQNGIAGYLVMLARTATNKLDAAGAIGPYEFSCRGDGAVNPFVFVGKEIY